MPPSKRNAESLLRRIWARRALGAFLLLPVALAFSALSALRRLLYRHGILPSHGMPIPVVVVGNITVGGSGKTPLVIHLANALKQAGMQPGIVSRGHGSASADGVREVIDGDDPARIGDEPLLIRQRTACPVFVGADRVATCRALLAAHPRTKLILADDGLQHYRLRRDFEIAVLDATGLQNRLPLPAGPLREPLRRLTSVDAIVHSADDKAAVPPSLTFGVPTFVAERRFGVFHRLDDASITATAAKFGSGEWHAVAGIAEPNRFFETLAVLGVQCRAHGFPDHHAFRAEELAFVGDGLLTTEKDAVKLARLELALPVWVLPLELSVKPDLAQYLLEKLNGRAPA